MQQISANQTERDGSAGKAPAVSVIVPIYNVNEFLEDCLNSLARQTLEDMEVLLIDDGSTDRSPVVAKRFAAEHDNFAYYRKENGGLGDARNYGAALAKGEYIAFADSDDIVSAQMYERLLAAARRDDSDMAICRVRRFNSQKSWGSYIHDCAFRNVEPVTSIRVNPNMIYDTTAWNKLIRREFYERHGFKFPVGVLYEDIPVTIPMHCLANRVSVVMSFGYMWREREGASRSITQQVDSARNLHDRLAVMRQLDDFFVQHPELADVARVWRIKALEVDVSIFLNQLPDVNAETTQLFMRELGSYVRSTTDEDVLRNVSIVCHQKIAYLLENDLEKLIELRKYQIDNYNTAPVRREGNRLVADLPSDLFTVGRNDMTDELVRQECRCLIDDIKVYETSVIVYAHIYARRMEMRMDEQQVQCFLFNTATGERQDVPTEAVACTSLTSSRGKVYDDRSGVTSTYDYDGSGFKVTIDLSQSYTDALPTGDVMLMGRFKNWATEGLVAIQFTSTAVRNGAQGLAAMARHKRVSVAFDSLDSFYLHVTDEPVHAISVGKQDDALAIKLDAEVHNVFVAGGDKSSPIALTTAPDNTYLLDCDKLPQGCELFFWVHDHLGEHLLPSTARDVYFLKVPSGMAVVRSLRSYYLRVQHEPAIARIVEQSKARRAMHFKIVGEGNLPSADQIKRAQLMLADPFNATYRAIGTSKVTQTDEGPTCSFDLDFKKKSFTQDLYNGERKLCVSFMYKDGTTHVADVYDKEYFRWYYTFAYFRAYVSRDANGAVNLRAQPMWPEDMSTENKRNGQRDAQYPKFREEPLDEHIIVFESMWGTKYSCNPRALYEYIDEHYPQYKCVWIFEDERTPIKGHGLRVKRGSMEYFHCLATAKYLVNNVNFEDAYVKRPGQVEIQTMHGTPLKTMGLDVPGDFLTKEAEEAYVRRNERWDYLLVQGRFMEDLAYQCFRCKSEALGLGYPRTDALISDDGSTAARLREQLGIAPGKKVVLYAPTWRKRNRFDMKLDIERMRERLGDNYVLLVRLHHLAPTGQVPADNSFVYDLTDYSSIEDLYQLADTMITDYSSTMFDYALLNKPMVFYAYDIDDYGEELRGMYVDLKAESPGPLAYTTDEIIDCILNEQTVQQQYAERIAAFKQKYLTYERPDSCEAIVQAVMHPEPLPAPRKLLHRLKRLF